MPELKGIENSMNTTCPECGALESEEQSCRAAFDESLVLEFTDPEYGVVHHLTVAAYMLQHSSKLSRAGWLYMRQLLREFLVENKPPAEVRKQYGARVDGKNRDWKITSRDDKPVIVQVVWTKTILDVRKQSADLYCLDITTWARAVLDDALGLVPTG